MGRLEISSSDCNFEFSCVNQLWGNIIRHISVAYLHESVRRMTASLLGEVCIRILLSPIHFYYIYLGGTYQKIAAGIF